MFLHHLGKVTTHTEFGNITVIQAYVNGSVVIGVHQKIRNYLLKASSDSLSERSTRTGIQLGDLGNRLTESFFFHIQFLDDLLPVFSGEFFITITDDTFFQVQYRCRLFLLALFPEDLYHQAFLKTTCSDTCRIKILQDAQSLFQSLFRRFDAGINSQFIADTLQRFAKQSVVVQRTDQVFYQFALMFGQVTFTKLFFQNFIKRSCIGERNIFRLLVPRAVVLLQFIVGNIVFGEIIA